MVRRQSARDEAAAQGFLTRRMEQALVRGDFAMHDNVLRAQSRSLLVGCVLAAVVLAAAAIVALLLPHGAIGTAPIIMARDSGALYVRIDDTLHPVFNLASARLVAKTAANPVVVVEADIARAKRGPRVGIPGAPAAIGTPLDDPSWTVCDDEQPAATVVIVGTAPSAVDRLDRSRSILVTPRGETAASTYLLYEGKRAEVDLRNSAVVRALRLDGVVPLPVSRVLLDAVPEVPAIAVPVVDRIGTTGPTSLPGIVVGTVIRVARADSVDFYVVLAEGVQRVGEIAADLIRFSLPGRFDEVPTVAPSAIAGARSVETLPLGHLPDRSGTPVGAGSAGTVCARWSGDGPDGRANTVVLQGNLTIGGLDVEPVGLAQADGVGPNVDAVAFPSGRSAYLRSVGIVGDDGSAGTRFLINDEGVVFGIHDDDAATALGLIGPPASAPWPILARLPRGPELGSASASIARDAVSPS